MKVSTKLIRPSVPSYSVIAADTLRDLVTFTFDLLTLVSGHTTYMAGHVFNPSTKFEDPTRAVATFEATEAAASVVFRTVASVKAILRRPF